MEIYIVFEYAEHTNKIVGCYKNEEDAKRKHDESPAWRYIEKQKLLWNRNFKTESEVNIMSKIWFRVGMEANVTEEEMKELLIYSG